MAARIRVGVTGNGRRWSPAWWCTALALRVTGAEPVRISVRHPVDEATIDALVIGGGDDIGPEQTGENTAPRARIDPERDVLESRWIRQALEAGLPVMGICRGAQLINVVLGGSLYRDIRHLRKRTKNRPGLLPTKRVCLKRESLLTRLSGKTRLRVNSLHHQAINEPGDGLRVIARDRDGICQAIECRNGTAVLGVQWHPEYMAYLPSQRALFRWLVVTARR